MSHHIACRMACAAIAMIVALSTATRETMAWDGFDWEEWRKITGVEKPDIQSPQAGDASLLPLLLAEGPGSDPIDSIQDWEAKRDRTLNVLQALIGEPTDLESLPPEAESGGVEDLGAYTRLHLRIRTEKDDWIPAYYLKPKSLPDHPAPTMIVLHQTVKQGKDEPCGIEGSPDLAFAAELAERGYICIVPDVIGFGERTPPGAEPYHNAYDFYRKHPRWSFFGKMVWDLQRVVDYLETLPEVDPYRIGCIGHSHGAYGTIMGTAFEPRISAAVASCGFTTLRTDPDPNRWSHLTALLPRLGYYVDDVESSPVDWHEIAACIAPRPYFNWATLDDRVFPNTENLVGVFRQIRDVHGLYGAAGNLHPRLVPGKHSIPKAAREEVYAWLATKLPPRPDLKRIREREPSSRESWEATREFTRELLLHDIGPVDPPPQPPTYVIVSEEDRQAYQELKILYATTGDEWITAYLLKPNDGKEKHPGIVVYHQTTEAGKEEAVGHSGRPSMHFAPELARRGYMVLAPDSICAGGRITASGAFDTRNFYQAYPDLSALGKMIQDGRRAIDILQSVPGVDPHRIATLGHSLGAEESLFVAAFDSRVRAAAASCGYAPFRTEKDLSRWARDHWFSYMPRLRIDLRAGRPPAWDFDDVIRLIAPRGYFNYQTTEDQIFPEAAEAHTFTLAAKPLWRLYGADEALQSMLEPGPHDIPESARMRIYDWIDGMLSHDGS